MTTKSIANQNQNSNQQPPQSKTDKIILSTLWNIFKGQDELVDLNISTLIVNLKKLLRVIDENPNEINPRLKDQIPNVLYEIREFYTVAQVAQLDEFQKIINKIIKTLESRENL